MSLFTILFTAALVNNFVLSQFLGICPFLGSFKESADRQQVWEALYYL